MPGDPSREPQIVRSDMTPEAREPSVPRMAAVLLPRELLSWSLLAVSLGALEGGLLGVIVKIQYSGTASPAMVNLAVALVAGAASFTNLLSFFFAARAMGRGKVPMLSRLMRVIAVSLCLMALMPVSALGLVGFTVLTVIALASWSGILTVRSVVWRANYPRRWRGQITARISQLAALLTALCSASVGAAMQWHGSAWRAVFPAAALCAVGASLAYRRSRVRRQRRLVQAEEVHRGSQGGRLRIASMAAILRGNRDFRNYMIGMMIFGGGNLMVVAMLVVLMTDRLGLDRLTQVLVTSSLPVAVLCLTVRSWAKVLDRRHIISYRVVQSWTFVVANGAFAAAMIAGSTTPLWFGSVLLGVAWGGGHLGWNLGHNDFAGDADASLYMATHVGLTGLRGLIAPVAGVLCIQWLETRSPGHGAYAMLLPLILTLAGWTWFLRLHLELRRREAVA